MDGDDDGDYYVDYEGVGECTFDGSDSHISVMVMTVTIHSYDHDTDADDDGDAEPVDDDDENCTNGGDWGNRDEHTIMSMLVMMMMYVVSARVAAKRSASVTLHNSLAPRTKHLVTVQVLSKVQICVGRLLKKNDRPE